MNPAAIKKAIGAAVVQIVAFGLLSLHLNLDPQLVLALDGAITTAVVYALRNEISAV